MTRKKKCEYRLTGDYRCSQCILALGRGSSYYQECNVRVLTTNSLHLSTAHQEAAKWHEKRLLRCWQDKTDRQESCLGYLAKLLLGWWYFIPCKPRLLNRTRGKSFGATVTG